MLVWLNGYLHILLRAFVLPLRSSHMSTLLFFVKIGFSGWRSLPEVPSASPRVLIRVARNIAFQARCARREGRTVICRLETLPPAWLRSRQADVLSPALQILHRLCTWSHSLSAQHAFPATPSAAMEASMVKWQPGGLSLMFFSSFFPPLMQKHV